ncbi:helix-turn-helix domain-containing protein [Pseudonocardia kunmingensis]|uniref:helix-turn-helix domain-containing protein n=1 Tax=Pseudonocardia kunmingensis TaxID=630975 RepID=UPI001B86F8AB|nr:helix-turn-helix domain-containing protein [Pseudonocardia kunmingensis]
MHSRRSVEQVRALCRAGSSTREIARITGIPERTVAHWRKGDRRADLDAPGRSADCPLCAGRGLDASYAYLLGAYPGDGHITTAQRTSCLWV